MREIKVKFLGGKVPAFDFTEGKIYRALISKYDFLYVQDDFSEDHFGLNCELISNFNCYCISDEDMNKFLLI